MVDLDIAEQIGLGTIINSDVIEPASAAPTVKEVVNKRCMNRVVQYEWR